MADVESALDAAGLKNPKVREFVKEYAELTGAERIEVVTAADDARLIQEALEAGELQAAGEGRYYSRSYYKDTARSEERTIVATNDEKDKGVYNNWRPASEMKPMLHDRMRGASAGKTMYVIPYLMSPPGNALAPWAAGVELTDTRTVVLHMIRMSRVGAQFLDELEDPTTSSAPSTSPATWRTSARAPSGTSATSSPSPTSARSCTSVRRTAATPCSARSRTACGRAPTTAGRARSSSPSSTCSSASTTRRPGRTTTSVAASRVPPARPTWR